MCFVVTCWERADLLALVCGVFCEFVTFPLVSWVRFWDLIVSIPDLCTITYFYGCYGNKNGHQNRLKIGKWPFWSKFETGNKGINIEHKQIPTKNLTDDENYHGT